MKSAESNSKMTVSYYTTTFEGFVRFFSGTQEIRHKRLVSVQYSHYRFVQNSAVQHVQEEYCVMIHY